MSLVEEASGTAAAAELGAEPPQRVSGTISGLVTGIAATGIATVTLGWIALLVRGAVWLVRG